MGNVGDVMGRLWTLEYRIKPVNQPGIHVDDVLNKKGCEILD
ncbi:hypothetical protein ACFFIX_11580 [Metabacillus herbersteinensis]|uniref:Uncharacterized protein n=1 Tax=Metabacillus herbersteinensis TaxID=283816 RepID=A0ABV6GEH9_9BACI